MGETNDSWRVKGSLLTADQDFTMGTGESGYQSGYNWLMSDGDAVKCGGIKMLDQNGTGYYLLYIRDGQFYTTYAT